MLISPALLYCHPQTRACVLELPSCYSSLDDQKTDSWCCSNAKQDVKNLDDRTPRTVAEVNEHKELLELFD